jgi:hypothetical protein
MSFSRGEIGRHAGLRSQCPKGVGVQVPPRAPIRFGLSQWKTVGAFSFQAVRIQAVTID